MENIYEIPIIDFINDAKELQFFNDDRSTNCELSSHANEQSKTTVQSSSETINREAFIAPTDNGHTLPSSSSENIQHEERPTVDNVNAEATGRSQTPLHSETINDNSTLVTEHPQNGLLRSDIPSPSKEEQSRSSEVQCDALEALHLDSDSESDSEIRITIWPSTPLENILYEERPIVDNVNAEATRRLQTPLHSATINDNSTLVTEHTQNSLLHSDIPSPSKEKQSRFSEVQCDAPEALHLESDSSSDSDRILISPSPPSENIQHEERPSIVNSNATRKSQTPLHLATISNNDSLVVRHLQNGENVDARDSSGQTPLHYAKPLIAKILLVAGANADAQDREGNTPLHLALYQRKRILFWTLLPYTKNLNTCTANGLTPLIIAVKSGMEDVAISLLSAGANIDATDTQGKTALHWAASHNRLNMVVTLLQYGPNLEVQDKNGHTPLHYAKAGVAKTLLYAGAKAVEQDPEERTPLHIAMSCNDVAAFKELLSETTNLTNLDIRIGTTLLMSAVDMGSVDMADKLIMTGADVNEVDDKGMTALHRAASHDRFSLANLLLRNGADLNIRDNKGYTPLHYAKAAVARILIGAGANVNIPNDDGLTPLHLAVMNKNLCVFQVLLPETADVNTRSLNGMTPLITAASNGMENVAKDLIKYGADINATDHKGMTALHIAALHKRLNMVNVLLQNGVMINAQDFNGYTALHYAKADIARSLINAGADPNILNNKGLTSMHLAVENCDMILFQLLLPHTPHLDTRSTPANPTPLGIAVINAMEYMVHDLTRAGADVNISTDKGQTPLHWAADFSKLPNRGDAAARRADCAQILLNFGADANALNSCGDTPLHTALKTEAWPVLKVLLRHNGIDLNAPHVSGKTLLMLLLELNPESKVEAFEAFENLINAGVCIYETDRNLMTAMHYAANFDKLDELISLVDHNADVNAQDRFGRTPLFVAASEGMFRSCYNLIYLCGADTSIPDTWGKRPIDVARDKKHDCIVELISEISPEDWTHDCNSNRKN